MIIAYYYIGNLMDMRESKQSHILKDKIEKDNEICPVLKHGSRSLALLQVGMIKNQYNVMKVINCYTNKIDE